MKNLRIVTMLGCLAIGFFPAAQAQLGWVGKAAKELVEAVAAKGGQQAAKELTEMGGEALAREALEKAAQEGGEKLAQKLAARTVEHGPALLKVAKSSPAKFLSAFDEMTPAMQKAAAQAMTREPDLMARLFSDLGKEVLTAAAKHPGVGTQVMEILGGEGAETLGKITTDEAIQLSRLAPKVANVAEPGRQSLMEMIGEAPRPIMDLLERHPRVMLTAAGVASFIAAKERLLGGAEIVVDKDGVAHVVAKPGFIERIWRLTLETFKGPLGASIWAAGLIMLSWGAIKLWGAYRIQKAKVLIKEAQLAQEAEHPRQGSPK